MIGKIRRTAVKKDSCFETVLRSWNLIDASVQENLRNAAQAAVPVLLELEPLISEVDNDDVLTISSQEDSRGKLGDVRDILISRKDIQWQIGLSLKHNHFAVKHSRLSSQNDFGKSWLGVECSKKYWEEIKPVFDFLEVAKKQELNWRQIESKEEKVYVPILQAFINEFRRLCTKDANVPQRFVEYLLGKFDFYKTVAIDCKRVTHIDPYNLHGTLNRSGVKTKPKHIIKQIKLPTRIISLDFKPNSKTTVELCLNAGWQFTMRLHNASSKVEPSLKFDIQCVGKPAALITIECFWKPLT